MCEWVARHHAENPFLRQSSRALSHGRVKVKYYDARALRKTFLVIFHCLKWVEFRNFYHCDLLHMCDGIWAFSRKMTMMKRGGGFWPLCLATGFGSVWELGEGLQSLLSEWKIFILWTILLLAPVRCKSFDVIFGAWVIISLIFSPQPEVKCGSKWGKLIAWWNSEYTHCCNYGSIVNPKGLLNQTMECTDAMD